MSDTARLATAVTPTSPCPSSDCPRWCCPAPSSPSRSTATPPGSRSRPPAAATAGCSLLAAPDRATTGDIGVVARVPNTATLPNGEPAAIVQAEQRGAHRDALHTSDRGADHADVELLTDARPTPRVEAAARELRVVLEEIAKLRQSRRLPEILRTIAEPGALADAVTTWSEVDDERRAEVLHAVDLEQRVAAGHRVGAGSTSPSCRSPRRSAPTSPKGSTSSSATTCCASSSPPSARSSARATTTWSASTAPSSTSSRSHLPEKTATFVDKEIDRLERMSQQSPEHCWVRTWLDRVFELPWATRTPDQLELDDGPRHSSTPTTTASTT